MNRVSVILLTHNSAGYLSGCLAALEAQTYPHVDLVAIDNGSSDGTPALLSAMVPSTHLIVNGANRGFSAGHNQGLRATDGGYVLLLNPDVMLEPDYVSLLAACLDREPQAGAAMGKLYTWASLGREPRVFDSGGVIVQRNRRTLDRGRGQPDRGQFDGDTHCFGASGAAPLYRRAMLDDVAVSGEVLDEDFFAYREEVDLAWRAQLLGWSCAFEPRAVAYHDRSYTPESRNRMPAELRAHMAKNRYLLMLKNDQLRHVARHLPAIAWFELCFWARALLLEPRLFGSALTAARLAPRMLRKRRALMARRRASPDAMLRWLA